MANPSRSKGTTWEVELLPELRDWFGPQVERAPLKGTADHGDFVGVDWLCEAKSTQKPLFQQWARKAEAKDRNWMIFWHGDRRSSSGNGPYVLAPLHLIRRLALEGK